MTIAEFKAVARIIKLALKEVEKEAERIGLDPLSLEYEEAVNKIRVAILERQGFTLEEYREAKKLFLSLRGAESEKQLMDTLNELQSRHIPTSEEISIIAKRTPPKIIH